jgi:hypothetical protein
MVLAEKVKIYNYFLASTTIGCTLTLDLKLRIS